MSVADRTRPWLQETEARPHGAGGMRQWLRDNSLSLVSFGLFFLFLIGQSIAGLAEHNQDAREHGQEVLSYLPYLFSGHFLEAMFENWESEFLQMAMFVVLTAFLYQKGSAESKDPDEEQDPVDGDPKLRKDDPTAPWPVRRGGLVLWLYSNSLSIVFALLFLASFTVHGVKGAEEYNDDQREHRQPTVTVTGYMTSSRFWFESFQNWQSEFLSLWAMVVFTIFLRQKGSAESKPVAAAHGENEEEKGDEEVDESEAPAVTVGS
jgi:hypothetical protein